MITLFKLETFKLLKRKKTLVVLIAFMLLTAFIGYESYRDAKRNSPENQIANMESYIQSREKDKNIIPDEIKNDEKKIEKYKQQIDDNIEQMKSSVAALKASLSGSTDWKDNLKVQISQLEERQKEIQNNSKSDSESEMEYVTSQLNTSKYLLEHNIKPQSESEFNAFNFIKGLVGILGQVFLAIGVAVFAADMVSGEASPPTMKLLLTQPVSRGKVLLSKFLSINAISILFIVGTELLAFLIVGLIFGFGDASYPTMVGAQYKFDTTHMLENGTYPMVMIAGSSHIITAASYVIRLLLLQSLYIAACVAIVFLISALVKNSMISMGASVVSMIAASIIFLGFGAFKSIARYVFVIFGEVGNLLTGRAAVTLNNPHVTLTSSVIVFVAWIVLSYVIAHIIFTKKDILI